MPSTSNAPLLCLVLAVVVLRITGNPIRDVRSTAAMTHTRDAESAIRSHVWGLIIGMTKHHEQQFLEEFENQLTYDTLRGFHVPSPQLCPKTNSNKESCLQSVVEGLQKYQVLLKFVQTEYPDNVIVHNTQHLVHLMALLKNEMKYPELVADLTSSQQEQLLLELDNPRPFHRKMAAHNILRQLHIFLIDGKRAIRKESQ